ncbi:MAG: hypothetical protein KatS3mg046_007 [Bellilinea sp.]|nr:MAG: hypothetical protein KatS3mg046_007 [Bellilinea sp.]
MGLIGSEKRLEYTAIGDCINTAKRIQENARPNQILVTQEVIDRLAGYAAYQPVEAIRAKGKREPVQVYEINFLV